MGDSTSALIKLRPVTFLYKPEYANGDRTLQYGLIAEEVAQVYPELVAYDNDGQPYTVRYQYITTMLLNEVQKQYRRAEHQSEIVATQQAQIKAQQQEIESLKQHCKCRMLPCRSGCHDWRRWWALRPLRRNRRGLPAMRLLAGQDGRK